MRSSRSNPVWYLPVSIGALLMLFPIWWMLVVSLKTEADAKQSMSSGEMLQVLPGNPQWGNYAQAVSEVGTEPVTGFLDALANSIVVTVLVVAATILSSSLVATAFARIRFRGRNGFLFWHAWPAARTGAIDDPKIRCRRQPNGAAVRPQPATGLFLG